MALPFPQRKLREDFVSVMVARRQLKSKEQVRILLSMMVNKNGSQITMEPILFLSIEERLLMFMFMRTPFGEMEDT